LRRASLVKLLCLALANTDIKKKEIPPHRTTSPRESISKERRVVVSKSPPRIQEPKITWYLLLFPSISRNK